MSPQDMTAKEVLQNSIVKISSSLERGETDRALQYAIDAIVIALDRL